MKLLLAEEVAALLRVPQCRVYELIRRGVIPGVHVGRQVRVPEEGLRRWIEEGGQALPRGWRREDEGTNGS